MEDKERKKGLSPEGKGILFALIVLMLLIGLCKNKTPDSSTEEANTQTVQENLDPVFNNPADGRVDQVEGYLKDNLNDPDSLQIIEWGNVVKTPAGSFVVRCKYRAKNAYGGYVVKNQLFSLNESGTQVTAYRDLE